VHRQFAIRNSPRVRFSMPEICKSASSGTRLVTWAQRITESVLSWRGAGVLRDRDDDYGNERLVPQQAMSPGIQT